MSDSWLIFVPVDPHRVPSPAQQAAAVAVLGRAAPDAESVSTEVSDAVVLCDCGQGFESVHCPACGADLTDWWPDAMDADFDPELEGFRLDPCALPCCAADVTLNDLRYELPQAFGRFQLLAANPGIGELPGDALAGIAAALGAPVRQIRRRI